MFPTQYPVLTPLSLVGLIVNQGIQRCGNPLFSWLAFGKIGENPVVTPSTKTQVISPTSINRYLQSVTVKPIPSA